MQTGFHKFINPIIPSTVPQGWGNQISSAIAVNSNFSYEPSWLHSKKLEALLINQKGFYELFPSLELNVGSVMDYLKVGCTLSLQSGGGKSYFMSDNTFNSIRPTIVSKNLPHSVSHANQKKVSFNIFLRPSITVLAYNSMLSGGLLSFSHSKYILPSSVVKHVYSQADAGLTIKLKKFAFLYTVSYRTSEFNGALPSFWGGLSFLFRYKEH